MSCGPPLDDALLLLLAGGRHVVAALVLGAPVRRRRWWYHGQGRPSIPSAGEAREMEHGPAAGQARRRTGPTYGQRGEGGCWGGKRGWGSPQRHQHLHADRLVRPVVRPARHARPRPIEIGKEGLPRTRSSGKGRASDLGLSQQCGGHRLGEACSTSVVKVARRPHGAPGCRLGIAVRTRETHGGANPRFGSAETLG